MAVEENLISTETVINALGFTHHDERPWDIDELDSQVVDKVRQKARHDNGRHKLSDADGVE